MVAEHGSHGEDAVTGEAMRLAFIGFGEAAEALAGDFQRPAGAVWRAYDLAGESPRVTARRTSAGVEGASDAAAALAGAEAAFCLVTADQAAEAAKGAAAGLAPGALWFDGNSCAPSTKTRAADIIEAAGGRYVDLAIMAPVHPRRAATPVLLAGPHAEAGAELLRGLGMKPSVAGDVVGQASSIKMLRSVMIKGLEALSAECLLAARRAGVEVAVLASLQASDPGFDWAARGAYNLERMMVHGRRRAAEMEEVCATLRDLGLPDAMSAAARDWQSRIGDLALEGGPPELPSRADRILGAL